MNEGKMNARYNNIERRMDKMIEIMEKQSKMIEILCNKQTKENDIKLKGVNTSTGLHKENIKLRKLLRKKANKIRAWNKLYKYHSELENDSQHHWEMCELMDTIIKQKLGEEE